MLRCAGRAHALWVSADFEVTLGFVDGLDFAVDMAWTVGVGYGAERGPELRRVVLGMLEDCGIKRLNPVDLSRLVKPKKPQKQKRFVDFEYFDGKRCPGT